MLRHPTDLRRMAALQDWVPECGAVASRRVFCQNWRADVVAVTKSDGTPIEYVRYSAYGEPTVYPVADLNMDGVVNSTDSALWSDLLYSTSNASVYADSDLDFDGLDDWNSGGADGDLFYESYSENLGLNGVGRVSSLGVANRTGYAGYQWDQTISAYHVRYRVYLPDIGRWTRRDPLGYVDSSHLYEFVATMPVAALDPMGLDKILCIVSNTKRANGDSFSSGHAFLWLIDTDTNSDTTWGLWPDSHPGIIGAGLANGSGSDVRTNYAGDSPASYRYKHCKKLTDKQYQRLLQEVAKSWIWSYLQNCSSFASDVFYVVTDTDIDADDWNGSETPREIGDSICEANGGADSNLPSPTKPGDDDCSSCGG